MIGHPLEISVTVSLHAVGGKMKGGKMKGHKVKMGKFGKFGKFGGNAHCVLQPWLQYLDTKAMRSC